MDQINKQLFDEFGNWRSHAFIIQADDNFFPNIQTTLLNKFQDTEDLLLFGTSEVLFSIKEVRQLQQNLILKGVRNRIALVWARKFPTTSQNAMLKLLEDGADKAVIIIVTSESTLLLPTIKSRSQIIIANSLNASDLINQFNQADLVTKLSMWDQVKESGLLGEIMLGLISDLQQNYHHINQSQLYALTEIYKGWQSGVVAPKYAYESLCLIGAKKM